jgi:hypothetical protein
MEESLQRKKPLDLSQELEIKRLEAALRSEVIRQKALDVLDRGTASQELSANMLLRIVVSLGKANQHLFEVNCHRRRIQIQQVHSSASCGKESGGER